MPRARQRACLEQGLKLDLNMLARQGLVRPRAKYGPNGISNYEGWLRIQIGNFDQWIELVAQPRRFGGRQWYFRCPDTHRRCSVVWRPPGASRFCSRQAWRRQVASGPAIPMSGTCRRSRNGCGGARITAMCRGLTLTRTFSTDTYWGRSPAS